jgi:hypothetical protein
MLLQNIIFKMSLEISLLPLSSGQVNRTIGVEMENVLKINAGITCSE